MNVTGLIVRFIYDSVQLFLIVALKDDIKAYYRVFHIK